MANGQAGQKRLTIRLTADQQKQVLEAAGKTVTDLTMDLDATVPFTETDLSQVTGGLMGIPVSGPGEDGTKSKTYGPTENDTDYDP
jgi:hypothetical protein